MSVESDGERGMRVRLRRKLKEPQAIPTQQLSTEAELALVQLARPKLVPIKLTFLDAFVPHNEHRKQWEQQRLCELVRAHGQVSAGVGALIGAAGWHHAAAEYANQLAAQTGALDQFAFATRLSNAARGNELAAWELASKEAECRRRNNPSEGRTMGDLLEAIDEEP
jgi:hypothetical protein